MYDVLIMGGGPAGLYAAYCLAKAGRRVAVFEEHSEIGSPVHCTGLVSTETFTRFDVSRPSDCAVLNRARFHSPGGRTFAVASDKDESVILDRTAFDRGLADQAQAAGAELFLSCRVESLRRLRGCLVARTSGIGGAERLIRGRLGIMATGVSYGLHRGLGLRLPDRFLSGAQVEVMFDEASEVEVYFGNHVAPESFAWVVPFRRQGVAMAKIGLLSSKDAVRYLNTFLQSSLVASRIRPGSVCRYLRRPVPVWPLPDTVGDRILAVGDAAGLVKPTTGGGVYYSLLSAELAAEAMGEALDAGDGSARFLSRYQTAWRAVIWPEIRMGGLFRSFAAHLSDAQIDEAFALVGREPIAQLIRDHGSFNWHRGLILNLWQSRGMRGFLWRVLMRRGGRMIRTFYGPFDVSSDIQQPSEESAAVD